MQTGLHAIGWGLSRFALVLGVAVLAAVMAYATLVFVVIAVQAFSALGQ
jgi:type IV secretory pathway VirB3-like protein